ncbi:DUF4365 domain-containing protein [Roseomonas sp. NAR14]|uniref:DUF4365 domain-containing protein n=1 Tax=Roseomonas acroporae TaxID=2937791 RepID=A0A9X1YJL0_9PROT|nr:DUF4365 domain-containing protein [Roseomonas acroporae]MCK8787366.1 DUF4365 domain-containing protein [Roseomonas acroporae]
MQSVIQWKQGTNAQEDVSQEHGRNSFGLPQRVILQNEPAVLDNFLKVRCKFATGTCAQDMVFMPITTHPNDIKERLSIAYVTAVAARAGCQISKCDIDKQSIDVTIRPILGRKISIDFQLKATSIDCFSNDMISFDLPVKNYDDLRDPHCTAPHYLIILVLDSDDNAWLVNDEEALLIKV